MQALGKEEVASLELEDSEVVENACGLEVPCRESLEKSDRTAVEVLGRVSVRREVRERSEARGDVRAVWRKALPDCKGTGERLARSVRIAAVL